ncbi:hypothetical protein AbraIFM66951_005752 [Aspergillus brasiliensis]|uniref:Uncharacterized protein n=1 Tax=Aspergillus brasiliensis TaxID=319629 RepID=A0A9W5YHF1_9EURO|nr:hypothetical protein AbraCBS73388_006012 [Aspergillus brasiliensis]GKZ44034.1 hypothetical protein AbraIFM66951_005752 [Aspergillus brasiliensis]
MKYQDGQVTSYSSQVIDLEANNHKLPMEDIPLSTYATAQAQPCDTPWPGSTQEQTESQEQAKAVAPRPGPAYIRLLLARDKKAVLEVLRGVFHDECGRLDRVFELYD